VRSDYLTGALIILSQTNNISQNRLGLSALPYAAGACTLVSAC
jgi:hypothetical protein